MKYFLAILFCCFSFSSFCQRSNTLAGSDSLINPYFKITRTQTSGNIAQVTVTYNKDTANKNALPATNKAVAKAVAKEKSGRLAGNDFALNTTTTRTTCREYTGSMIVTPLGGTPPFVFNVSGIIQNNGFFWGLNANDYDITVTDSKGLTAHTTTTIVNDMEPPAITVNLTATPNCAVMDGKVTVTATGGKPPYLYSMDGTTYVASNVFSNLASGFYRFFVKDANGCVNSYNTQFDLISYACVQSFSAMYSQGACDNDGFITLYYEGNPPYQFSMDGVHYQSSNEFVNLPYGNILFYIKDGSGNVILENFFFTKSCKLAIANVSVSPSCHQSNGVLTATAVFGQPPYTYSLDGVSWQASNTFTGLAAGNYMVAVKDANGDINGAFATLEENCPQLGVAITNETCNTSNATITVMGSGGTPPYQFSIDGTHFTTSNVFTGLKAGNFTVTIKDANSFTQTTDVTITNNCLQATATVINATCGLANGSITTTASGGELSYQYSLDATNYQFDNVFTGLKAGNYTVTVKDGTGTLVTANATIAGNPAPVLNLGNDTTLCPGATLLLAPGINAADINYTWQDGSINQNYLVTTAGNYTLQVVADGCTVTDQVQVSYLQFTNSIFTTHDTTLCQGNALTLNAGNTGATYVWDNGSTAQTRTVITAGKYWVTLGMQGCKAAASDTVNVHYTIPPIFTLGNDTTLCNGTVLTLNKATAAGVYQWSTGSSGTSITINKAGLYWLMVADKRCSNADTINVFYKPNPILHLGADTTLCIGQQLLLNAYNVNAMYTWQDGSAAATYNVTKQGIYNVNVSANGCDTSGQIHVQYADKPIVNLGNDTTLCQTDKLQLSAYYPLASYVWQNGSVSPDYLVTKAGTYSVSVANNCGVTQDAITVAYEQCACELGVPSAFSPNNDGRNDVFKPVYKCSLSNYLLKVYDRWGKLVFTSNNIDNGWKGNTGYYQYETGAYIWILHYHDNLANQNIDKSGTVVLVR